MANTKVIIMRQTVIPLFFLFLDKYTSQFGGMVNQYAYYHEEDDTTFQLVDTARVQKPIYQRGRIKFNQVCLKLLY